MGLNNAQVVAEYEQTLGVDETSNEASIPAGYVRSAWNANLGLSGGYVKRGGHSDQLSAAWTGLHHCRYRVPHPGHHGPQGPVRNRRNLVRREDRAR
jgi:hypothetical protein